MKKVTFILVLLSVFLNGFAQENWQSKFVKLDENQNLVYLPDEQGNIIPDFSRVGYESGEKEIPDVGIVETIMPVSGDNLDNIQMPIDRISKLALNRNGFRGTLLLKKGIYNVNGTIDIRYSGIVIRGEGSNSEGTVIRETATKISGTGK